LAAILPICGQTLVMKKLSLIAIACAFTLFISCDKDDNSTNGVSTAVVSNTVSQGNWRITYYWDSDHDETSDFSGYTFSFGGSNVLTATNGGSSITGTWTTGTDDSKTKLILNFSSPESFAEISDDWHVIEITDTRIKLQDVSGGGSGTDYLTFEKN
jgi:hypothetical protein